MVLIFGECHQNSRNAAALYAERYSDKYHPPQNYFLRIVKNLREKGELPAIVNHRRNRSREFMNLMKMKNYRY